MGAPPGGPLPHTIHAVARRWRREPSTVMLTGVVVLLVVTELVDLLGGPDVRLSHIVLAWLGALACIASLWRTWLGVLLALPPIVSTTVLGSGNAGLLPFALTLTLASARGSAVTLRLVAAGYAALIVVGWVRHRDTTLLQTDAAVFLASVAVGLAVRVLTRRSRHGAAAIRRLEEQVVRVRAAERRILAHEVSVLLADALEANQRTLAAARAADSAVRSRHALTELAEGSRMAVAQLRHLVGTLRDDVPGHARADATIRLIEEHETRLIERGIPVELELPDELPVLPAASYDSLARFLDDGVRHILTHSVAGSTCTIDILVTDEELSAAMGYPTADGPVWTARMGVPRGTSRATPAAQDPWTPPVMSSRPPKVGRLLITLPALGLVAWFVLQAVAARQDGGAWQHDALWALAWGVAATSVWSPVGTALCATLALAWTPWVMSAQAAILPPTLSIFTLAASATSRRPTLLLPVALGWLIYVPLWARGSPDLFGLLLAPPLLGGALGVAAHFFLARRATQQARLADLRRAAESARALERRHLAAELHDILAHQLSLITVHLTTHDSLADRADVDETIALVSAANDRAQTDLTTLVNLMHLPVRSDESSTSAPPTVAPVQHARSAAATLEAAGHPVRMTVDLECDVADPTTSATIGRVLREATTNILRYAPPGSPCVITLATDSTTVGVEVLSALPQQHRTSADSTGLGLAGLRERTKLTGGTFTSGPEGEEWRVSVALPRRQGIAAATP